MTMRYLADTLTFAAPTTAARTTGARGSTFTARAIAHLLSFGVLMVVATAAHGQSLEAVATWNRILIESVVVPGANPPTIFVHRPMAIVSVAVFDAANSFDRIYHPYAEWVDPAPGASRDAAIAQAAHDTLVAVLPSLRERFAAALVAALAGIPDQAARDGAAVGAAVAAAILEKRTGDGWARTPPEYLLPSLPGYWQPTPPGNGAAAFTHYPDVTGFIVASGRRFLMEAPPALTSTRYAADFAEVKAIGRVDSTTRTAEQTQMARLWHGVGTSTTSPALWNVVLADIARTRAWTGLDLARGFALLNMTQHDALLTSFTGKFLYGFWRPVTAIRDADRDGNEATDADLGWTSLLNTPPYPGHPGNRACLSASQARLLERLFGRDDIPLQVTWRIPNAAAVTRGYAGFRMLANEEAKSRIWGGIHFEFESLASQGVCTQLADYAADNVLRHR
jgi:hypothetical protein